MRKEIYLHNSIYSYQYVYYKIATVDRISDTTRNPLPTSYYIIIVYRDGARVKGYNNNKDIYTEMGCVFFVSLSVSLAHTSLSSCHCSPRCRIALSHIRCTHVIIIIIIVLYTVAAIPVVVVGHHGGIGIPCVYIRAYNILLCV